MQGQKVPEQQEIQAHAYAGTVAAAQPQPAREIELARKLRPEHRVVEAFVRPVEPPMKVQEGFHRLVPVLARLPVMRRRARLEPRRAAEFLTLECFSL